MGRSQPAFYLEAAEQVAELGRPSLAGFTPISPDGRQKIFTPGNVGPRREYVDVETSTRLATPAYLLAGSPDGGASCPLLVPGQPSGPCRPRKTGFRQPRPAADGEPSSN